MGVLQNHWIIYACVFMAIVLPVAFRRRSGRGVKGFERAGAWDEMPGVFRMMWDVIGLFEFPFGVPLAKILPAKAATYRRLIPASGLPLTPEKILCAQFLSFLGASAIGAAFFFVPGLSRVWAALLAVVIAFVGAVYPAVAFQGYVEWRQTEISRALPFAIDLIGSAMRAGLNFGASLRYFVGLKMKGPLTEEFGKVLQQIELGKTIGEALSDMAGRIRVEAFTSFVGVVAYGTEIGASISETLRIHGEELRRARFNLAERKAARAPSLMILPMAVFIMPAVFIIVITPMMIKMKGTGIGSH